MGRSCRVVRLLDELGVHFIEGGWPGANPKDDEFFARAIKRDRSGAARLVAFGSTRRPRGLVERDAQLQALLAADTEFICIVGKSWDRHVTDALNTSLEEGLDMVGESIAFLRERGKRVFFDAEHFFDGFRNNSAYALSVVETAADAGAERVVALRHQRRDLPPRSPRSSSSVATVLSRLDLGVHFHNDSDCAVASSLAAVSPGSVRSRGASTATGSEPATPISVLSSRI